MKRVIISSHQSIENVVAYLASLPKYSEIEYTRKDGTVDFGRKLSNALTEDSDPYAGTSHAFRSEWLYGDDIKTCHFDDVLNRATSWRLRR